MVHARGRQGLLTFQIWNLKFGRCAGSGMPVVSNLKKPVLPHFNMGLTRLHLRLMIYHGLQLQREMMETNNAMAMVRGVGCLWDCFVVSARARFGACATLPQQSCSAQAGMWYAWFDMTGRSLFLVALHALRCRRWGWKTRRRWQT